MSDSTIERLQKKRKCSEAIDASTQNSTHDLCTVTLPLYFRFEEQHAKRKMRRVKKGANYRLTAGWPETNLIIIIVKNAQRKPAASPLPPQSNREAFSLRNDLQSDKSNRFTVTAWKGPARTLLFVTWPDLLALLLFPFPLPPPLSQAPIPSRLFQGKAKNEAGSMEAGNKPIHSPPARSTRAPFKREGKALLCGS